MKTNTSQIMFMKTDYPFAYLAMLAHFIFVSVQTKAQKFTGTLTDLVSHQPVIGAIINVKGTNESTSTDASGNFSLTAPSLPFSLIITNLGYMKMEYDVTSTEKPLRLRIKPDEETLEEVEIV